MSCRSMAAERLASLGRFTHRCLQRWRRSSTAVRYAAIHHLTTIMKIFVPLLLVITSPVVGQTRPQIDSVNPLRRCAVVRDSEESTPHYAVRCAEHFIAEQGY